MKWRTLFRVALPVILAVVVILTQIEMVSMKR
jgi:hypothetical protein